MGEEGIYYWRVGSQGVEDRTDAGEVRVLRKVSSGVGPFCKHRGTYKILDEVTHGG